MNKRSDLQKPDMIAHYGKFSLLYHYNRGTQGKAFFCYNIKSVLQSNSQVQALKARCITRLCVHSYAD